MEKYEKNTIVLYFDTLRPINCCTRVPLRVYVVLVDLQLTGIRCLCSSVCVGSGGGD